MKKVINDIEIVPVIPDKGLIAFASFILYESIYCSSVGIFTRPEGGYRLLYPTKKTGNKNFGIFYPINKQIGTLIEQEVITKLKDDRYNCTHNPEKKF